MREVKMSDNLAVQYLIFSGLLLNVASITLILIEAIRQAWKAYYKARAEILESLMRFEEVERERNFSKVKNI